MFLMHSTQALLGPLSDSGNTSEVPGALAATSQMKEIWEVLVDPCSQQCYLMTAFWERAA